MRTAVRDAFVDFTSPLEGMVQWMYADTVNLITTGIGNLIEPVGAALRLPWHKPDGSRATTDQIRAEWMRVKSDPHASQRGHRYTQSITHLRLTDDDVHALVMNKVAEMDEHLASRFPDWESYPADAQLATLSMSWACGPAFRFPALDTAIRDRNWDAAVVHCTMNETGNPGLVPRNAANRRLYSNAAKVEALNLDFDVLVWPGTLTDSPPESTPDLV